MLTRLEVMLHRMSATSEEKRRQFTSVAFQVRERDFGSLVVYSAPPKAYPKTLRALSQAFEQRRLDIEVADNQPHRPNPLCFDGVQRTLIMGPMIGNGSPDYGRHPPDFSKSQTIGFRTIRLLRPITVRITCGGV